jgi:hypothetical protein
MSECICSPIVGSYSHKVIGRAINTTCPVHGVDAPEPRSLIQIGAALEVRAPVLAIFGERTAPETLAEIAGLCREFLAATGGA